jgi:Beta/Gamma crystallin
MGMTSKGRTRVRCGLGTVLAVGCFAGTAVAASTELTLYSRPGLRGDHRTFTGAERDLGRSGWADRAASVRIEGDAWELCREADYRECTAFSPGVYELRDTRFERQLLSVRPLRRRGGEEGPAYTRTQARSVAQGLYRALLDRNVDEESIRAAVNEIEDGRLQAQIDSIVRSPEFRSRSAPLGAEALLDQIYRGLLGRPVDPGGTRTYLARIQRREYTAVVMTIVESREYRSRLPR